MKNMYKFSLIAIGLICFAIGAYEAAGVGFVLAAFPNPLVGAPFGLPDVQTPAYAATLAVTITNHVTFLSTAAAMTGAMTLNLTIDSQVKKGATLIVSLLSDATARTLTFGTGMAVGTMAGVISKTKCITFVYNGTIFTTDSAGVQID